MITFISHLRASPANRAALEALLAATREATRANEPDVLYYDFAISADDPGTYVMIEVYRDAAAHAAHMESAWVGESLPKAMSLIEGKADVRQYVAPGVAPAIRRFKQE